MELLIIVSIVLSIIAIVSVMVLVLYHYKKSKLNTPKPQPPAENKVVKDIVNNAKTEMEIRKPAGIKIMDKVEASQNGKTVKVDGLDTDKPVDVKIEVGDNVVDIEPAEQIANLLQNSGNYIRTPIKDEKSMNEDYYLDLTNGNSTPEKVYVKIYKLDEFEEIDVSESSDDDVKKKYRYLITNDDNNKVLTKAGEITDFNVGDFINGLYEIEFDFEDINEVKILCNGLYYDIITNTVSEQPKKYKLESKNTEIKKLPVLDLPQPTTTAPATAPTATN